METNSKTFPAGKFELLVRSYLDNLVEWEVLHTFAIAHIDDEYAPEYQRPLEDLHMMFFPEFCHDSQSHRVKPQIRYLLDVFDLLKSDVEQYGVETVRAREMERMASEDPTRHIFRMEFRNKHRKKPPE